MWKDPKEMAEDPNATPGSIKPNSLTLNTNINTPTPFGMMPHQMGPGFGGPQYGGVKFIDFFACFNLDFLNVHLYV